MPLEVKEIQVGYLYSPYFKNVYLYLLQNQLPSSKSAIGNLETLSEKYVLLDSLLFRIPPEKETAVLVIPEMCMDKIITLYHKSLFVGHQGVIKTFLTISDKFFIPNLIHYLRSYIKGCHICQLSHNEKPTTRYLQTRINPNCVPMSRLSMDLKVMPRLHKGHRYILCIIDEVTNFLITCKCRFLILFFHMFSYLLLINSTIFVRETSFQQVLLSSSGPKENIFISKFITLEHCNTEQTPSAPTHNC